MSNPIGRMRPIDGTVAKPQKLLREGKFGNIYSGYFGMQSAAIKEVRTDNMSNGKGCYGTIRQRDCK